MHHSVSDGWSMGILTGEVEEAYTALAEGRAARLPELVPGARHQELPWAGHLPSLERPAETTALLAGFLSGQPGFRSGQPGDR